VNKKRVWRIAMIGILIIVGLEIYNRVPPDFDWNELRTWKPALLPLIASVLILAGANVLHAILWRRMSIDLGSPAPNARATLHIYFVSSLSRYVVKLGQVAGLAVMAAQAGMAAGRATAAALVAELIKMATGFLLVGLTMPRITHQLDTKLPIDPAIIGVLIAIASVAAVWIIVGTSFGHSLRETVLRRAKGRTGERLRNAFAVLDEARPRDAAVWAVGYFVAWIVVGVAFALFVAAFIPLRGSQVIFVGGIAALSYLIGYFSIFPAGLGFREGSMLGLLSLMIPVSAAATISIASRFWFTAGEVLPLLLIPLSGRTAEVTPRRTPGVVL
jgi:hypothetical protein